MNMQQICVLVQENKDVSHFAFLVFVCVCVRQTHSAWAVYLSNLTN